MNRSIFVCLHAFVIVIVTLSLLTGLRIASLNTPALLYLDPILIDGAIHELHLLSGYFFSALVTCFIYYQLRNNHQSNIKGYHLWINRLGYNAGILSVITGWLINFDLFTQSLQALHFVSALLFIIYFVLHSWVYILQRGKSLTKRIIPIRTSQLSWTLISSVVVLTGLLFLLNPRIKHSLFVSTIAMDVFIEIDGNANEPEWLEAESIVINTTGGANFIDGNSQVTIKALSNKQETFFLFTWQDPTQSLKHLPLLKTPQGWKVTEDGFYRFDEQSYYEDKFAVMLSNTCKSGADDTVHLGKKPLKDKPSNWHGKGYHASLDGIVRDLWHWKAVRTNDMYLADDNFIGAPAPVQYGQRRYSAGYQADSKESGSYVMNWQWYSPDSITPKRLPTNYIGDVSKVLPWFGAKPYTPELDTLPEGSYLPSVLYRSNRFEGDRADVRARAQWDNGLWTLELVRKKETNSKHDVSLKSGVCMWVSAFDRSQIAHTRHHKAIELKYAL